MVVPRIWFNPNQQTTWNTVPSLVGILTTLMGLVVTALSVARERELGTFEQLLVSPLGPREIIIGKTLPALLIGIGQGHGMVLVGVFAVARPVARLDSAALRRHGGVSVCRDRRRAVRLVAGQDPAAGHPGNV